MVLDGDGSAWKRVFNNKLQRMAVDLGVQMHSNGIQFQSKFGKYVSGQTATTINTTRKRSRMEFKADVNVRICAIFVCLWFVYAKVGHTKYRKHFLQISAIICCYAICYCMHTWTRECVCVCVSWCRRR